MIEQVQLGDPEQGYALAVDRMDDPSFVVVDGNARPQAEEVWGQGVMLRESFLKKSLTPEEWNKFTPSSPLNEKKEVVEENKQA